MATIDLKISGIAQIRSELKALKGELANATDPQQMAKLAEQAGVLSDQLKDANEQVAVFASGSKFEQTSNALGLMGSQIRSLDFEGAATSAKLFASSMGSIKPAEFANQLKSLGSIIGSVGKAFISFGASLLVNPIFLIAAAVVAIVAAIGLLLNELGFLQPILDAIGWAFGFVKDAIMATVQAIKDLLDALGITNYKAEEFADGMVDAWDKVGKKAEEISERRTDELDKEIRLAKIAGKSTVEMELEKQRVIKGTMQVLAKSLEAKLADAKERETLDEEEIKALEKKLGETKKTISDSTFEIKAIKAQEAADEKKRLADDRKEAQAHYKQKLADQKAYEAERLKVARQIEDLLFTATQEGINKDVLANKLKYDRLIADMMANEKMLDTEKQAVKDLLLREAFEKEKELRLVYDAELQTALDVAETARQEKRKANALAEQEAMKVLAQQNKDYARKTLEIEKATQEAKFEAVSSTLSAISSLVGAFAGKSEAQQKRAFQIQKAISIAQAVMETYKGANAIFASAAANPATVLFPAQPFIMAGAAIATGLANVAVIARTQFGGGGGGAGSGGGSAPSMGGGNTSTQQAQPNYEFFGGNNNANNQTSAQDVEQTMTVVAVVSETEITSTQNKIKKITDNASL